MREIKFRIWDQANKRMVFGEVSDILRHIGTIPPAPDNHYQLATSVESSLPEQFTGLKDKNGREIYEGDIIAMEKEGVRLYNRVQFQDSGWHPFNVAKTGYWTEKVTEVIGNIHENPELLTK